MRNTIALTCALALLACSEKKRSSTDDEPSSASPASGRGDPVGFSTIDGALGAYEEAMKLAATTWPDAKLSGVRVSEEVPAEVRRNLYTLRLSFEFGSDPSDPTAKSGSIVCYPGCKPIRHKVKGTAAAALPCSLEDALEAARAAGLRAARPVVGYGNWNLDGKSGITFRDKADGPSIEVGASCKVAGP